MFWIPKNICSGERLLWGVFVLVSVHSGECLLWWMFVLVSVSSGECLFWWGFVVVRVCSGDCLFWWVFVLVSVCCGECLFWWLFVVVSVYSGECLFWNKLALTVPSSGLETPQPPPVLPLLQLTGVEDRNHAPLLLVTCTLQQSKLIVQRLTGHWHLLVKTYINKQMIFKRCSYWSKQKSKY